MPDYIYWTNSSDEIRRAPLAGGAGTADIVYGSGQGPTIPFGLAVDAAAGRIYWANYSDDTIRDAPVGGGGPAHILYRASDGVSDPVGLAIHPAAGRIYWSNSFDDTIRSAPLYGGGPVEVLYDATHGLASPGALAIDPAAGHIYWSDAYATIWRAPLAGRGAVLPLYGPTNGAAAPTDVAVDTTGGRIYWASTRDSVIQSAALAGGGSVTTLYDWSRHGVHPFALAIDPAPQGIERIETDNAAGVAVPDWLRRPIDWLLDRVPRSAPSPARVYWANWLTNSSGLPPNPNPNTIQSAPVAGGPVETLYRAAQGVDGVNALALLRAPRVVESPLITWSLVLPDRLGGMLHGGGHAGPLDQRLSCSRGIWAPDLLGCSLYRAPQAFTYQWRLNGTDVGGATRADHTPTTPGAYTCLVTASNAAGSAAELTPPVSVT